MKRDRPNSLSFFLFFFSRPSFCYCGCFSSGWFCFVGVFKEEERRKKRKNLIFMIDRIVKPQRILRRRGR
jgi:hypothetical protein